MEAKFFSYKVTGIVLQVVNDNIKLSESFNKKELLNEFKEWLKEQGYKIDQATLDYKLKDDQLFITGIAVKDEEPKSIGFMAGK